MMIQFDVRTLFFVGSAAALTCSIMLWLSRNQHPASRPALEWSSAGLLCAAMAMLLISLRDVVSDHLTYVLANALGPWATVLMYESVRRIAGVPPVRWLVAGSGIALLAIQAWLGPTADPHEARVLITSALQGGFAAASIPLLRRRVAVEPDATLRWMIAFCVLFSIAHLVRFLYAALVGASLAPTDVLTGFGQAVLHAPAFALVPIVYAMILIGLVNRRIARELWALATIDTLTGVRTRRSFIDESRRALTAPDAAAGGAPVAPQAVLLMLDMDRFKQVNDQHGHAAGDRVLVRFAELLRKMAPAGAVVGRYGGEEFCMLLPGASVEAGVAFANTVCDRVRSTAFAGDDPTLTVTVSIGLAGAPDGRTLEELLLAADRRLYLAKDWGRDQVVSSDRPTPRVGGWRQDRPRLLVPI